MFDKPFYLLLIWLIPCIAALLYYGFRQRRRAAAIFLDAPMIERLMPQLDGFRVFRRSFVLLAGLALVCLAAAGPKFGIYFEDVSRKGADIFVLLDVSRSMLAEDAAPNRLQRAKSDIKDLLQRVVGDRVGLIVFAGKPVNRVPLTTDHGFYNEILDHVDTNSAPLGGTAIGDAIRKALDSMQSEADRDQVIVLITDGEDQESMPLEAAKAAAARNVRILAIGLGDTIEGARIPINDAAGNKTYLKHDGHEVWSKVDEETLRQIAQISGGVYVPAGTSAFDLGQIYTDLLSRLQGGEYQLEQRERHRQQYQVFLALAVLFLLLFLVLPEFRAKTCNSTQSNEQLYCPAHKNLP